MKVGILALQGDVGEHAAVLRDLGVEPIEVRHPVDLDPIDAVVLPGGESTALSLLMASVDLGSALAERLHDGLPALGTCAGMILLAREVADGRADQVRLGAIDIAVRRNAFGRQVDSFETDLDVVTMPGERFHAVFIRAPLVERTGPEVEILATVEGRDGGQHPVLCRQGSVVVAAFHPELSGDARLHELFLERVGS
ncbi:MAG: pyridoxal 5'-phosphate synthase glutaminase subunit PdxT [Actinomycetota bacterium]|nr:pyridoxal 5'-phosphate synthase glutaminase subunit PdxT [Actinomycetota bacterium]